MTSAEPRSVAGNYGREGFGIDHLPYGSFSPGGRQPRLGVRIGEHVLDVEAAVAASGASGQLTRAVRGGNLDSLLAAGRQTWQRVRAILATMLADAAAAESLAAHLYPLSGVRLHLPFTVADYVDFYANEYHATNVGHIFRPGQPPLTGNWKHLPIAYHGRAGTIVPSGTDVPRPKGIRAEPQGPPAFGPSRRLDIEAEIGFVLGGAAPGGEIPIASAADHIFGLVLTNDWSARDIQAFETVPLGPNLGKSFATSVAVWVTPLDALPAARVAPPERDTPLTSYLDDKDAEPWGFDIAIEVLLNGQTVSRPPFAATYWTAAQMLAHMTVNGAGLRPGDFFAGGTVSGPRRDQRGCFLELCWGGREPLTLQDGTEFTFLRDGDQIVLRATAPGPDGSLIRLADCAGRILPSTA